MISVEPVVPRRLCTPFVEAERRVGKHGVKPHQRIASDQLGRIERVRPFDLRTVESVEEHIHSGQGLRLARGLLSEQLHIGLCGFHTLCASDMFGGTDEKSR